MTTTSNKKRKVGRPKIEVDNALDLYNLQQETTQHTKSVKLKESTYNMLVDIRDHNPNMKSLDHVIVDIALSLALFSVDNKNKDK